MNVGLAPSEWVVVWSNGNGLNREIVEAKTPQMAVKTLVGSDSPAGFLVFRAPRDDEFPFLEFIGRCGRCGSLVDREDVSTTRHVYDKGVKTDQVEIRCETCY